MLLHDGLGVVGECAKQGASDDDAAHVTLVVPAVRIGRLAVAARAYRAEITAFAIVVDAKDAAAVAFYAHYHGFVAFASAPMTLYLPLAEAATALGLPSDKASANGQSNEGPPKRALINLLR